MARRKAISILPTDRFTADNHFGHSSIVNMCARPFSEVADMDRGMIDSWNAVVGKNDRVFHLGDFAYWRLEKSRLRWLFGQLTGEKHLIVGNHDTSDTLELPWASVSHLLHFKTPDGLKVAASHHPQREWDGFFSGGLHFHGHTHSNLPSSRRSLDVGVDNVGFVPQTYVELRARMNLLPELDFTGVEVRDFDPSRDDDDNESTSGYGRLRLGRSRSISRAG
jgi:calcineurin-like phosphoesterase family protein